MPIFPESLFKTYLDDTMGYNWRICLITKYKQQSTASAKTKCFAHLPHVSADVQATIIRWCKFWSTGKREDISNRTEISCLPLLNAGFEPRVCGTDSPADWMLCNKLIEPVRITLKPWNQYPVPIYNQRAFTHSTRVPVWLHPWLWR